MVVAIIALLVAILMPALAHAKELAKRLQCATNLRSIGEAVGVYQATNNDINPAVCKAWENSPGHFGMAGVLDKANTHWYGGSDGNYEINGYFQQWPCTAADLYMLVRFVELLPATFLCPSSTEVEMDIEEAIKNNDLINDWTDLLCFQSGENISYCYNWPYYEDTLLDGSSSPKLGLAADMNPNLTGKNETDGHKNCTWKGEDDGIRKVIRNSRNHKRNGQNVLFAGFNVKWCSGAKGPLVGIAEDNIYTYNCGDSQGVGCWGGTDGPVNARDTYIGL